MRLFIPFVFVLLLLYGAITALVQACFRFHPAGITKSKARKVSKEKMRQVASKAKPRRDQVRRNRKGCDGGRLMEKGRRRRISTVKRKRAKKETEENRRGGGTGALCKSGFSSDETAGIHVYLSQTAMGKGEAERSK